MASKDDKDEEFFKKVIEFLKKKESEYKKDASENFYHLLLKKWIQIASFSMLCFLLASEIAYYTILRGSPIESSTVQDIARTIIEPDRSIEKVSHRFSNLFKTSK